MRGLIYEWLVRRRARHLGYDPIALASLLNESQRWPPERLAELRNEKLRRLVAHAYEQVPYYRRMMDQAGVRPEDVQGVDGLNKLPVMTKDMLRQHWDDLRARDLDDERVTVSQTGGTTGIPVRIARDVAGSGWWRACYIRGLSWGGLTVRDRRVRLFGGSLGVEPPRRFRRARSWLAGETFLPAFELGPHNVERYAERIRRSGAHFLIGYTSACYLLATLAEQIAAGLTFTAVYPTAELLLDEWVQVIGRVFSAKVLPYYGCGEVNSLGYYCTEAPVYHTCDEHAVIEVETDGGQTALVGEGSFLVTDLDNFAMPFIRYRNGDAGQLAGPGCACGRSLGRITRLDGRVNDMLVTAGGARICGAIVPHSFRLINNVESYQLVQNAPGQATIRIVRAPPYDPASEEPKLRKIFGSHLGSERDIQIEYVSSIPCTPAGKARFVLNEYLAAKEERDAGFGAGGRE